MFAVEVPQHGWSAADEERALAILCQLILEEINEVASLEQRRGLLTAVGRRLAALISLPTNVDLDDLAERISQLWTSLNWGSVGFELDDQGIDIVHRGLPFSGPDQLQDWDVILPPLLEGAYSAWFEQLGGASHSLQTRIFSTGKGEIEFRHGL